MLRVNADDLGRDRATTDAILACYSARRVSCASAMVFMEDSERAAELARGSGISVGLHINLSETFSGVAVPAGLRADHDDVCRFLRASKYSVVLFHPGLVRQFRNALDQQYAEFLRLYGRPPSHLDGHQHMHLASNVLLQKLLPPGTLVRRSFSFLPGERGALNRWYRALVDRSLARRHVLTDFFFALSQHLSLARLERVIDLAGHASVELMAHPHVPAEYEFLMSDGYLEAIAGVPLAPHTAAPNGSVPSPWAVQP